MGEYKSGIMPNACRTYEQFEGFLASYYFSFKPLEKSKNAEDIEALGKIDEILNGFLIRHKLQTLYEILYLINPRSQFVPEVLDYIVELKEESGNIKKVFKIQDKVKPIKSNYAIFNLFNAFGRNYKIGMEPESEDGKELKRLVQLTLETFKRHKIAEVADEIKNQELPLQVEELYQWREPEWVKPTKSLEEVLKEENSIT